MSEMQGLLIAVTIVVCACAIGVGLGMLAERSMKGM